VYESHQKADDASNKLLLFKEEESLLLNHLQMIELQSIHLHTVLAQLAEIDGGNVGGDHNPEGGKIDIDLIHEQKKQLKKMEEEVSHEVENLQKRIQLSARNHIIQEFGEGPVQVVLDLDLGDAMENAGPHRITILLWHDTPHAAWTWLEQIGNNVWDGAEFNWHAGHTIDAIPPKDRVDPERDGQIEFVEHSQHEHTDWTVGVREQPTNGSGRGSMSMYINLRDNSQLHKYETCVGKVVDGFDALQKLLELSRNNGNGDQQDESSSSSPIKIRKATAEHYVTKKAGMGK
jgi:cyclophilin family peptidyl-prolyl cis-trans isomerase